MNQPRDLTRRSLLQTAASAGGLLASCALAEPADAPDNKPGLPQVKPEDLRLYERRVASGGTSVLPLE